MDNIIKPSLRPCGTYAGPHVPLKNLLIIQGYP